MKLLPTFIALAPLLAIGEESFFFTYPKDGPRRQVRIEDANLHVVTPIQKIAPLKGVSIHASHQGLGPGREYQIQIDLAAKPEGDAIPMLKLGDDVITGGIYLSLSGDERFPPGYHLQSDDPEQILRWCPLLGTLLEIPEDRIEIDLTKAEEDEADPSVTAPGPKSDDHPKHLEGEAKWKLGSIGTLTLKMEGDSTVFLLNGDQEVFRLKAPEYIKEAQPSEDGKALLLVAMKPLGGGSDFATLVRVQSSAGKVQADRVLDSRMKLFEGRRWWLSDLGAMSSDGTRILAEFGVTAPDGRRILYRWHTVELPSGKILGEGMTIENGKTSPDVRPKK